MSSVDQHHREIRLAAAAEAIRAWGPSATAEEMAAAVLDAADAAQITQPAAGQHEIGILSQTCRHCGASAAEIADEGLPC